MQNLDWLPPYFQNACATEEFAGFYQEHKIHLFLTGRSQFLIIPFSFIEIPFRIFALTSIETQDCTYCPQTTASFSFYNSNVATYIFTSEKKPKRASSQKEDIALH